CGGKLARVDRGDDAAPTLPAADDAGRRAARLRDAQPRLPPRGARRRRLEGEPPRDGPGLRRAPRAASAARAPERRAADAHARRPHAAASRAPPGPPHRDTDARALNAAGPSGKRVILARSWRRATSRPRSTTSTTGPTSATSTRPS